REIERLLLFASRAIERIADLHSLLSDLLRFMFILCFGVLIMRGFGAIVGDREMPASILEWIGDGGELLIDESDLLRLFVVRRVGSLFRCISLILQLLILCARANFLLRRVALLLESLQIARLARDELTLHVLPRSQSINFVIQRPTDHGHHQQRADEQDAARRATGNRIARRLVRFSYDQRVIRSLSHLNRPSTRSAQMLNHGVTQTYLIVNTRRKISLIGNASSTVMAKN